MSTALLCRQVPVFTDERTRLECVPGVMRALAGLNVGSLSFHQEPEAAVTLYLFCFLSRRWEYILHKGALEQCLLTLMVVPHSVLGCLIYRKGAASLPVLSLRSKYTQKTN